MHLFCRLSIDRPGSINRAPAAERETVPSKPRHLPRHSVRAASPAVMASPSGDRRSPKQTAGPPVYGVLGASFVGPPSCFRK